MNKKLNIKNLKPKEIISGFKGRFVNGENLTWAFWEIKKDSSIPEHFHVHEQIMHVISGSFSFTLEGETSVFGEGDTIVIPSNCKHCGSALTDCKIMDVFCPKREEYK
tara:strand:- start:182 stop:505 length:324 start_codon:yes stop_codon:yes gene_type:complete